MSLEPERDALKESLISAAQAGDAAEVQRLLDELSLPKNAFHGLSRYNRRVDPCRCQVCREAMNEYQRSWRTPEKNREYSRRHRAKVAARKKTD